MSSRLDPELLAILVCPRCKGELDVQSAKDGSETALNCGACSLSYPVEDGIPVMLVEEAQPLGSQARG